MTQKKTSWKPKYTITSTIARALMEIESACAVVDQTPLSIAAEAELRRQARVRATHYSTRIEGNRLTLAETEQVVAKGHTRFQGRERDVREVQNYWNALLRVEEWAERKLALTEELVQRLHALVQKGSRARPTPYRDGQNMIRELESGEIIYMPPEAPDVPGLMSEMIEWVHQSANVKLPIPLVAGLAHYQFVTIHPYYDGNGRTARLLATLILHRNGYGLNGYFSLEEYHARDLAAYYRALTVHPHHNYYEGRADADLTGWLEYFTQTLAQVFAEIRNETLRLQSPSYVAAGARPERSEGSPRPGRRDVAPTDSELLHKLEPRARQVIVLFAKQEEITSTEVAETLSLSQRMARVLLNDWVEKGWLVIADPSNRNRAYALSAKYRQLIGNGSSEG